MLIEKTIKDYFDRTNKFITEEDIQKIYKGIINICLKNNIDINSLSYLSEGESSLAFITGDKIIKFIPVDKGIKLTEYLKDSKYIVQPLVEETVSIKYPPNIYFIDYEFDMSIVITEKLNTDKEITLTETLALAKKLLNDGYIWTDIKPKNIGIDKDGNIKLFDYGQLSNRRYDKNYSSNLELFNKIFESLSKTKRRNFFKR